MTVDFVVGLGLGAAVGIFIFVAAIGQVVSAKEVFERGHMVQCLGKTGYYWECE